MTRVWYHIISYARYSVLETTKKTPFITPQDLLIENFNSIPPTNPMSQNLSISSTNPKGKNPSNRSLRSVLHKSSPNASLRVSSLSKTQVLAPLTKEKIGESSHSKSPHLILLISNSSTLDISNAASEDAHAIIVKMVSIAFHCPHQTSEDGNLDMSDTDDLEDDDMSKVDETDDSMTLDQFQQAQKCESLIYKVLQDLRTSYKKLKVDKTGVGS